MKNGKWKIILICFLILPIVVLFGGCSCGGNNNNDSNNSANLENQTFTVMFYTGSSETSNIVYNNVPYNTTIREPNEPTRTDYEFKGWCVDIECTTPWTFTVDTVKHDTTLYAKWVERN